MAVRWSYIAPWVPLFVGCMAAGSMESESYDVTTSRLSVDLAISCDDHEADLYRPPASLPKGRGDILRCVDDGVLSVREIDQRLSELDFDNRTFPDGTPNPNGVSNTYQGAPATGPTHVYRVLYRTERGNGAPGFAVATIYMPEESPHERLPLLLLARGSRGQAASCAPSVKGDGPVEVWPLVAAGFAVVATDSAGYAGFGAEGNPPSAYADITDMGKSLLDSGFAMKKLLPQRVSDDVFIVGLSQGGHTALGSLQVANEYAPPGTIKGAVVESPLWFAQRAWGSVLDPVAASVGFVINKSAALPVSFWYHYTHAELYDGPGEGAKLFKPEVRGEIEHFVEDLCWLDQYPGLASKGSTAADFFEPDFIAAVANTAFSNGDCSDSPNVALCQKWIGRYRRDHPVLTGDAAKVPIMLSYGLRDDTIPPQRMRCALDKLALSHNPLDLCIDPDANHGGNLMTQSEYAVQWLKHKAFGEPITAECPRTSMPKDLECDPLLPNDPVEQ